MRRENLIQRIQHMGDAQVLDFADMGGKIFPEIAQHFAPVNFPVGDAVELLFEICGEVIFYIFAEEGLEESGDHAALVLGNEPFLVEAHIAPVADRREHRHIGRWPADPKLFQFLDDGSFRDSAAAAR